jgi:hypothetical protein
VLARESVVHVRVVRGALTAAPASIVLAIGAPSAEAARRPFMPQAQAVFDSLSARDRNEIILELKATGEFNAMAPNDFGGHLYDATASCQANHGIDPTGILTPETRQAASMVGSSIFISWGSAFFSYVGGKGQPKAQAHPLLWYVNRSPSVTAIPPVTVRQSVEGL